MICGSGFPIDTSGNPGTEILGVPTLGGLPLYPNGLAVCNTYVDYEDEVLTFGNNCEVTIKRTWTIQNWDCSVDNSRVIGQLFTVIDTTAPIVLCPSDVTMSAGGINCEAEVIIPALDILDACNPDEIRVDITYPGGFAEDTDSLSITLSSGVHTISYAIYDVCGNLTLCSYDVTVVDSGDPAVVCDNGLSVSLSSDGQASLTAAELDNGSFDACGEVSLGVRRVDSDDDFGDQVFFDCEDVMDSVLLAFQVTDEQGRSNQCMVPVAIQDNVPVQLLVGLPDVTVSCTFPFDDTDMSVFGTIVNSTDEREAIVIDDDSVLFNGEAFDAVVVDNCTVAASSEVSEDNRDQCGAGYIIRTVTATSPAGETVDVEQRISFVNPSPFVEADITWPEDFTVTNTCSSSDLLPENLAVERGFPRYEEGLCDQVAPTYEDRIVMGGGCFVIERTWYVCDWCQRIDGKFVIYDEIQLITVENTIAPVIDGECGSQLFTSTDQDCADVFVVLEASATDDCLPDSLLIWTYSVDIGSDDSEDLTGSGSSVTSNYPVGIHTVTWSVSDGCGNIDFCEQTFEVQNTKAATPICFEGLSTALSPMDLDDDDVVDGEFSMLTPEFFDAGSYHTCGNSVKLSFSADITDTLLTFDCNDQGIQTVELWLTDALGNSDFCSTTILVEDNNDFDFCPAGGALVDVTGTIYTEEDLMVGEVQVLLDESEFTDFTDEDGKYSFSNMPLGGDYKVVPKRDIEHMNGVTTIDLVIIQRHILGSHRLDSPYKLIAADVNNSSKITAADLLTLRKMILGLTDEFPNNTSWRFMDASHDFFDDKDPWTEELPEDYPIYNLATDMAADFVGVKTGDVNGSVQLNGQGRSEIRSTEEPLVFSYDEQMLRDGGVYRIPVYIDDIDRILAYQFTLQVDPRLASVLEIVPLQEGFSLDHFGMRYSGEGLITSSWNPGEGVVVDAALPMFELLIKAKSAALLSDLLSLEDVITSTEAYSEDGSLLDVELGLRDGEVLTSVPELKQNQPNPWTKNTTISFHLPKATNNVRLMVYDVTGKLVLEQSDSYEAGDHEVEFVQEQFATRGVYYYELITSEWKLGKKMVLIK